MNTSRDQNSSSCSDNNQDSDTRSIQSRSVNLKLPDDVIIKVGGNGQYW